MQGGLAWSKTRAETSRPPIDAGLRLRKGAGDSIFRFVTGEGGEAPPELEPTLDRIDERRRHAARRGPLVGTAPSARWPQAPLRLIIDSGATTVIPTITSEAELLEHVGAAGVPELSGEELERVSELYEHNEPVGA